MSLAFVTVVVPLEAGTDDAVRREVRKLGPGVRTKISQLGLVHFMSLTVISMRDEDLPHGQLLIELSTDCAAEPAVRRLAAALEDELDAILRAGAPRYEKRDLAFYLLYRRSEIGTTWANALSPRGMLGMPFDGIPQMTVARIEQEEKLTAAVMASRRLHGPETALEKLRMIRDDLWAKGHMKWAFQPMDAPFLGPTAKPSAVVDTEIFVAALLPLLWPMLVVPAAAWRLGARLDVPALGLFVAVVAIVVWGALAGFGYLRLRRAEAADVPDDEAPSPAEVAGVMERENAEPLNLLITVSRLKPGLLRRLTLRGVLRLTRERISRRGRPGFLGEHSEIGTLHSGRWIVLPGTDLLVFVAHYDGSLISYMQDFVDLIAAAPTGIWSNTRGFPRTRLLFGDGAADADRATAWFHRQQRQVDFSYAAFPKLTLSRIRFNAAVRNGFAAAQTEREAAAWLALFGAPSSASVDTLRGALEVPTLAFGALTHLPWAACLVFELPDDGGANRRWLGAVKRKLTYGLAPRRRDEEPCAHVLGLSATGLAKLGLAQADLDTFPAAFVNGMTSKARAQALGDNPEAETWAWGNATSPADAVLIIYAGTKEELDRLVSSAAATAATVVTIRCAERRRNAMQEPFGFSDGLSQPIIPGTPASDRKPSPDQVVAPGEFVLGYRDGTGFVPPSPSVPSALDVGGRLRRTGGDRSDLGRDSSFLVVRHLQQHVREFHGFACKQAAETGLHRDRVKAKMIGRWQNGSSLVRHPLAQGRGQDNDFRFVRDDPDALACPRGAHIRRANPRDALHPDVPDPVAPVNRHRILRVGRPYADGAEQGTLFMCLNADIERQFELVQQAWLRSGTFDGLRDEADPLIGGPPGAEARNFTIPTADGPLRLAGMTDFVTTRGGGYFWMPSAAAVDFLVAMKPGAAPGGAKALAASAARSRVAETASA